MEFVHVKGHAGDPGNEAADRLANQGADQYGKSRHFLVIKCFYMHICTETEIDKIFIYYSTTTSSYSCICFTYAI